MGNSLTKTGAAGWDAGASSTTTLAADGYVEFGTGETNTWKMGGLSNGDTNQGFADIDFAFYLAWNGQAYIVESGTQIMQVGPYATTDTFRVSNTGGTVEYYQNDTLVYTSTTTATSPLLFDCSLYSTNATINNVVITPVTFWQNDVGVSTSTNSITKTGTTGWTSGASTSSSLAADGYVEFTTAENTTWKMAGLSNGDTDRGFADIDYAIYLAGNGIAYIYENGVYRAKIGAYVADDVFRITNTGGTVTYYLNTALAYTSTVTATSPLLLDTSLYSNGATINNVDFTDAP